MEFAIIIAVLCVVGFIALRSTVKHLRGQGSCCGGGGAAIKTEEKILDAPVIMKKTVVIEGMHCVNCETSVVRAFNRMEGVSAKASYKEGRALLSLCRELSDAEIRMTVCNLGFSVSDIVTETL